MSEQDLNPGSGVTLPISVANGGTGTTSSMEARRTLGAQSRYQIIGTRCGNNGMAGFAPNASQAGIPVRIRHILPYGGENVILVYGGFKVSAAVEGSMALGGGYQAATAAVVAGGTGYVVGDTIVPNVAAHQFAPTAVVQAVTAGVVTQLGIAEGGMFGIFPTGTLTQNTTSGSGTGCTMTLASGPYVCGLHIGFEQAWNTQTAYSTSALTGVLEITAGANYNGTEPNLMLPAGDFFYTDPILVTLAAGAAVGTRIYTNGYNLFGGRTLSGSDGSPALNEFAGISTFTDNAWGGTYPTQITSYNNSGYQPLAILGQLTTPVPSFIIIGDSIAENITSDVGGGLSADSFDTNGNTGWCEKSIAQYFPWSNFSCGGDQVENYLTAKLNMRLRSINTFQPSHILFELGINDFVANEDFATFLANCISFWNRLTGMGVKEIWVTTITPRSSSSNGFIDLAGQTPFANDAARQSYNAYLRSPSNTATLAGYGVTKILDIAAIVESGTTGKWIPLDTYDGTHPSKAATTTIVSTLGNVFSTATL